MVQQLEEAAKAFEDGLNTAPTRAKTHLFTIVDAESTFGEYVQQKLLEQRFGKIKRHEPKLGGLGRWLAERLASVAAWLDPTSVIRDWSPLAAAATDDAS
jgi:hypothetical protein